MLKPWIQKITRGSDPTGAQVHFHRKKDVYQGSAASKQRCEKSGRHGPRPDSQQKAACRRRFPHVAANCAHACATSATAQLLLLAPLHHRLRLLYLCHHHYP